MDPEQTFIRVQVRFSQMLTPRIRAALVYIYLILAIALLGLLVVMHANYVQQPGCSSELSVVETLEAQIVHIKITSIGVRSTNEAEPNAFVDTDPLLSPENLEFSNVDGDELMFLGAKFWSNWIGSGARRSKLVLKSWKTENEYHGPQSDKLADSSSSHPGPNEIDTKVDMELPVSTKESFRKAVIHFYNKWHRRFSFIWGNAKLLLVSLCQYMAGTAKLVDVPKWLHIFHLDRINSFAGLFLAS